MKIIEPVTIEEYSALLMRKESGASLELSSMPQPIEGYARFRAVLEVDDVDRIFLWFEFHQHTKHGTAKRTDAPPETVDLEQAWAGDSVSLFLNNYLQGLKIKSGRIFVEAAHDGEEAIV